MKMAHSMHGIYSPLPQSLSDSESEKEITMEPICTSYNSKNLNNFEDSYRQNGHSIQLDDDVVRIKRGASKMLTPRKIAFVASIILCFLPIFVFLWVLPCSELHTCPVKISNWEYHQEAIELKGPIHLVSGVYKTNFNLAILYKGSINSPKSLKHGVISFMGLTGSVAWDFEQDVEPLQMDCSLIDTNLDGALDCLIVDSKGLKAIETISGEALWHAHSSEENQLVRGLDLPIALPDWDRDGVKELLSVFEKLNLIVISGRTGRVLGKFSVSNCTQIREVTRLAESHDSIAIGCGNSTDSELKYQIKLQENFKNAKYQIELGQAINDSRADAFSVANRKLTVNNGPDCPKCHCVLTLYDDKDRVLKTWTYQNAFIMNPKTFSFVKGGRGRLNGFIVKIWQWSEHYRKLRPTQRINKRSPIYGSASEAFYSTEVTESVTLITFNDTDFHVINVSYTEIGQICRKHEASCQPSVENQMDSLLVEDLENDSSHELVNYYSSYVKRGEDWHLVSYVKVLRLEEELPKLYGNK